MGQDEWEARWEDDGGALERQEVERGKVRSGVFVVLALVPFFVMPIVGMAVGRYVGFVGLLGGALLGFILAIGIAHLLGQRLVRPSRKGPKEV